MNLTIVQHADLFAAEAHGAQVRKYTGEPYIEHPRAVMRLVTTVPHTDAMLCAALLHDVVEDTHISVGDIGAAFGIATAHLVDELTDKIPMAFGNRAARKKAEAHRFSAVSTEAKTIKLADVIDNTRSIVQHDPGFARVYLAEKADLLLALVGGDPVLYAMAQEMVTGS